MTTTTAINFRFSENDKGQLVLHRDGHDDVADVRLRRAFPWSKAEEFVSVRDDKGKEIVMIERLSDLAPEQRTVAERFLANNSFLPKIERVERVNNDFGYQMWNVISDRGPLQFRVQEREDIRFLPDGRFSIKDVDGNIYVMPRVDQLDEHSRHAIRAII